MTISSVLRALFDRTYLRRRLFAEFRFETRLLVLRWNYRLNPLAIRRRLTLKTRDDVKLNFGCGSRIFPGWVNIDAFYSPGVDIQMDLRMPLPLGDNSTRYVFAEHILEHMDRVTDVPRVLGEFRRVLKPGGAVRIIVPDLAQYCDAFLRRDFEWLTSARPDCSTHIEAINTVFYDHFHRYNYDADALSACLRDAGFSDVSRTAYGESRFTELRKDLQEEPRSRESLCVEAVKS